MRSQLSEVSFVTAFSYELVTMYGFYSLGAPIFPSLKKEKLFIPGDDVYGFLFFVQFKMSEYIIGPGASLREYWGLPFFRYQIQPKNKNQIHKLMQDLEKEDHFALYVSPAFYRKSELFDLLRQQAVIQNSTFWSPTGMGELTPAHRNMMSFKSNLPYGILEPADRKIQTMNREEPLETVIKGKCLTGQPGLCNDHNIRRTGDRLLEIYSGLSLNKSEQKLVSDIFKSRETVEPSDYLSLISTLLYDCYVYFYPAP
ncbi:MAG: hypothetical protein GX577_12670 [Leptolinea sp.]|nr:hypothetical protein [Leptolinea sp.]